MARTVVTVGFSVLPSLAETVERIALEEGRSKSALFRDMVRTYQEQRELAVLEERSHYGLGSSGGTALDAAAEDRSPRSSPGNERVAATLPIDLVCEIDRIAEASGLSRSAILREASAGYVAAKREQEHRRSLREATDEFLVFLDELRKTPVLDDRPVLEILREMRGPLDRDVAQEGER
jgi:metal-responsive CopG/Arc/MetJ family transcriptional regulator